MSLRFGSIGLFFSLVAIVFAANYATTEDTSRGPASIAALNKEEKLGLYLAAPTIQHTEKLRGPLSVKLEMVGPNPASVGDVFIMRGTIASKKSLTETHYSWTVPKGVELVNGQLSGTLNSVNANQPAFVELTLRKISTDNAQVHLMASSVQGQSRFGDSTNYNTDLPDAKKSILSDSMNPADLKVFH